MLCFTRFGGVRKRGDCEAVGGPLRSKLGAMLKNSGPEVGHFAAIIASGGGPLRSKLGAVARKNRVQKRGHCKR